MIKKIALSGIGIILLASPVLVSADVLGDLQAQLQALLTQITAMKAQMGEGQVAGGSAAGPPLPPLPPDPPP